MRSEDNLGGGAGGSKKFQERLRGGCRPPDPPDWRPRRERPPWGGHRPPDPPRSASSAGAPEELFGG
eukprot:15437739-Alexandrium_andersonii.AAC.1